MSSQILNRVPTSVHLEEMKRERKLKYKKYSQDRGVFLRANALPYTRTQPKEENANQIFFSFYSRRARREEAQNTPLLHGIP